MGNSGKYLLVIEWCWDHRHEEEATLTVEEWCNDFFKNILSASPNEKNFAMSQLNELAKSLTGDQPMAAEPTYKLIALFEVVNPSCLTTALRRGEDNLLALEMKLKPVCEFINGEPAPYK